MPSVSLPVLWSALSTICTFAPGLMLLRVLPSMAADVEFRIVGTVNTREMVTGRGEMVTGQESSGRIVLMPN